MRADFDEDDSKTIWQNQPTEGSTMSSILIRQKARQLRAQKRRQAFGIVIVPVVVAFFYAFCIKQFPHVRPMLHLLFGAALVWSFGGMYFLNPKRSSGEMAGDAGFSAGLEFCCREIERQLGYFRRVLVWVLGPILLAIGTLVLAVAVSTLIFPKGIPFVAFVVIWIAAFLFIGARQRRNLQRELDELRQIEGQNGR